MAHLDRPFDYLVPAELDADAVPGVRVKVRFAGQLVDGWLLERADDSGHTGRLAYLEKVVSPEPVLAPEVARLARAVADRYAGNLADVLRLAVPPRHARVEKDVRARAAVADESPAVADESPAVADESPAVADESPAVADESPAVA
ncbi:primosomal protein N', partial [Micromonospora sp. NPDC049060]